MKNNKIIGNFGEDVAVKYLEQNKYTILDRNFFTKFGEIDIICEKDDKIIFFEVKTRTSEKYGYPAEAVNYYKKMHLRKSAEFYLCHKKLYNIEIEFNVIEILISYGNIYVNHIYNIM